MVGFIQVLVELTRVHALFVVFHEGLLVEAVPGVKLIPDDGDDAVASPLPLRLQTLVALRPGGYPLLVQFPCDDQGALAVAEHIEYPFYDFSLSQMYDIFLFIPAISIRNLTTLVCPGLKPSSYTPLLISGYRL